MSPMFRSGGLVAELVEFEECRDTGASVKGSVLLSPLIWYGIKSMKYSLVDESTLGFATMGLAANLGIATATPLTDLLQFIIATLDITTSNFCPYLVK